jgi:hypothetical protein
MSKRKCEDAVTSKTVYVLYVTHHVDCFKRPSSTTIISGVYETQDKSVMAALESKELKELIDDYQEIISDPLLQMYQNEEIPKTKEDRLKLFNMLCKIQMNQQPTFTTMATGSYFKMKSFTIQ